MDRAAHHSRGVPDLVIRVAFRRVVDESPRRSIVSRRIREEDADVKHIHLEAEALRRAGHAGERPAM